MKFLQKAGSVAFTLLIAFFFFLAYGSMENRWYRVVTIQGNSMSPTLWIGDMIVVTPPSEDIKAIPLGAIVVMNAEGSLVTHRLIGFEEDGRPITKGDANETQDAFENPNIRIVGIYRLRLPGIGYPLLYISQMLQKK